MHTFNVRLNNNLMIFCGFESECLLSMKSQLFTFVNLVLHCRCIQKLPYTVPLVHYKQKFIHIHTLINGIHTRSNLGFIILPKEWARATALARERTSDPLISGQPLYLLNHIALPVITAIIVSQVTFPGIPV